MFGTVWRCLARLIAKEAQSVGESQLEPTIEQLRAFYRRCVRASNLLQSINVVRLDERTKHIYMLIGDTIQIEIYPNGEVTFP